MAHAVVHPDPFADREPGKVSGWGLPEVWLRFLFAVGGLALAFGAALFSTVSREAGNLWATLIFASLALLLAMFVGLTTVPYLARRISIGRVRNIIHYEVPRAGLAYFLAMVVIAIAAINTGNNLLYIVLACLLGAIVASAVVSGIMLSKIELDVRLPEHIFAGETTSARVVLRNTRRHLPVFSLNVVPTKQEKPRKVWRWVPATFAFPTGRPSETQWFRFADWKLKRVLTNASDSDILQKPAYFPYVAPSAVQSLSLPVCFSRRGRYQQKGFGLATRFPFAFLKKTRLLPSLNEIIVFPAISIADRMAEIIPQINGEIESFLRGQGMELYSIRDSSPADSSRHVDWKATAKSGSLKVREFVRDDERKLRIVFDNPAAGTLTEEAYEAMVRAVASLSWRFAQENVTLSFAAPAYSGDPNIFAFLSYLAIVEPLAASKIAEVASPLLDNLSPDPSFNLVFTAQSRAALPQGLLMSSRVFSLNDFLA